MAVTPTPKLTPANFPSLDALQHLGPFAVALSGGADSTALLIACATRWPGRVHAVHVHHGLQAAAVVGTGIMVVSGLLAWRMLRAPASTRPH